MQEADSPLSRAHYIVGLDLRLVERWRPEDERPEIVMHLLECPPAAASAPFVLDLERYFAEILGGR